MNQSNKTYILIVDDNQQNLIALKAVLEELNQFLVFATSAQEALRAVLQYDFAVILLDVQMPITDGFETARLIRSREKSSYTPIIFLSAWHKDEMDIHQGYGAGAVDYIFKPINPLILKSKVTVFVDLFTKSILAVNLQNELKKRLSVERQASKQKHQLELAQLDRINTMEEMSSTVAHELNQPLAAITNYVKGCIHRLNSGKYEVPEIITALQRTAQQAERAGAILHRIKSFVRKRQLFLEPVNIEELLSNIPNLLSDETLQESKIEIRILPSPEKLPTMLLDKIQLEQVLSNLLRNSIEALQDHGPQPRQLTIETALNTPQTLTITVRDNGPGIPPPFLPKLFDLYFTTKTSGMGVGLSICRTIIEAHGGHITANNNAEGGACFQMTLPVVSNNDNNVP
jgi:C4-dicarboxylate-specific signal transduction histidine kinase